MKLCGGEGTVGRTVVDLEAGNTCCRNLSQRALVGDKGGLPVADCDISTEDLACRTAGEEGSPEKDDCDRDRAASATGVAVIEESSKGLASTEEVLGDSTTCGEIHGLSSRCKETLLY